MSKAPSVFVSSTFYNLKQIRADLKDFITILGLTPVISEYDSFPIDPTLPAVENCLKVVDENADIFVLIIGVRYGTIKEHGQSVTNMEYLKARAKNIPIYVFIEKAILNVLPLWTANPSNDFSAVVDTTKLFEFVVSVRDTDAVWTLPFETAQDIIQGLNKQLAYLFMDALNYRKRFKTGNLPPQLSHLTGVPLQILLERPPFWEHQLFANTFADEIKRAKEHEWDLEYGIILGSGDYLQEPLEVMKWISKKMAESSRIVDSFSNLINTALPDALGPRGLSGDPIKLVYTSRRLGETYKAALDWARAAKQLSVSEEFQNLVLIVGRFLNRVRKQIDDFSHDMLENLNAGIAKGEAEGGQIVIEMNIVFELEGIDEFIDYLSDSDTKTLALQFNQGYLCFRHRKPTSLEVFKKHSFLERLGMRIKIVGGVAGGIAGIIKIVEFAINHWDWLTRPFGVDARQRRRPDSRTLFQDTHKKNDLRSSDLAQRYKSVSQADSPSKKDIEKLSVAFDKWFDALPRELRFDVIVGFGPKRIERIRQELIVRST